MGPIYSLEDVIDMLRRRWLVILSIALLGTLLSVLWALSVPHSYRSAEVIQIEQPQVADALAPSTVEGSAARRLQLIEQQLLARDSLAGMIERFDLFPELRDEPLSIQVQALRNSISIEGVAAAREGYSDDGAVSVLTIAVTLGSPEAAQTVAHALADRTRGLSAERRQAQARETLEFFRRQEEAIAAEIEALEETQAAFRRENDLLPPEEREVLQTELGSLNGALLDLERDIIAARLARDSIDRSGRPATVAREEVALEAELESLISQRQLLQERRDALARSLEVPPEVETELSRQGRRLGQLRDRLDSATARRNEAEVGFTLESNARGERLITLEEAQLPVYPVSTPRRLLAAYGAVLSGLLALAAAFLLELRNPVLRSARQMERETGLRPVIALAEAPRGRRGLGESPRDRRRAAGQRGRAARLARQRDAADRA
jgi:uncharacterized protein involved in exopolysaccharide biosynthesis